MNGDSMYPHGFHPVFRDQLPGMRGFAWPYSRASAPSRVTYYFADFGMSTRFRGDAPRLVVGDLGADREVPELSATVPYDPFKADIFILGNVLRQCFYEVGSSDCRVNMLLTNIGRNIFASSFCAHSSVP